MKHLPLDEWTKRVALILQSIEVDIKWVSHYAKKITDAAKLMEYQPDFETNAEAKMAKALADLIQASEAIDAQISWVSAAIKEFRGKEKVK